MTPGGGGGLPSISFDGSGASGGDGSSSVYKDGE